MSVEIKVPVLPESVADATVLTWHKQAGDAVERDEVLVELETDKVVLEVPAPDNGVLQAIHKEEGATVTADEVLALIEPGAAPAAEPAAPATEEKAAAPQPAAAPAPQPAPASANAGPSARRVATELGVDASKVQGSGQGGRVTRQDVELQAMGGAVGARPEERVPMSRLRARVAERLLSAQQNAAILTTFNEVNLQSVMDLRKKHQEAFQARHGIKLGFMSFFVKAAIEALKRFPSVNASIDGQDIIYHGYYDIGIAVSTERGLVVPIIRDADQLGLADIEKAIGGYAAKARENKITLEEMTGGTFTLTNGGVFGSLVSTPIINPPQTGILGMHTIQQRPIAENGEVVVRPMMYLALSYDHRLVDGKESVQFLVTIKRLLEDPAALLLDI